MISRFAFKHEGDTSTATPTRTSSTVKKERAIKPYSRVTKPERHTKSAPTATPGEDAVLELPCVPDYLAPDLNVMFVGFNPGIQSSTRGHHYAGATNFFWPFVVEAGLTNGERVGYADDSRCVADFSLGFTNIVSRPSRSSTDLHAREYAAGVSPLLHKINLYAPRIVCFVGLRVWEAFNTETKHIVTDKKAKAKPVLGVQPREFETESGRRVKLFVTPATSGRVTAYTRLQRLDLFRDLKVVVDGLGDGVEDGGQS
ncbi:uracil-DNA glycosylase-like protein [Powellomyces hirtus]|nr:uracil-DNA glycosylase-like protein [Powellomyces hirtus]